MGERFRYPGMGFGTNDECFGSYYGEYGERLATRYVVHMVFWCGGDS